MTFTECWENVIIYFLLRSTPHAPCKLGVYYGGRVHECPSDVLQRRPTCFDWLAWVHPENNTVILMCKRISQKVPKIGCISYLTSIDVSMWVKKYKNISRFSPFKWRQICMELSIVQENQTLFFSVWNATTSIIMSIKKTRGDYIKKTVLLVKIY
jgi:hypothetical protein